MSLTVLNNGKPVYYPPRRLKVTECMLWATVYGVIWAVFGAMLALPLMFVHVAFPLAYTFSRRIHCSLLFYQYVQTPFLNYDKPKQLDLNGARNIYIRHQSTVDDCQVDLGVWHVLPRSVYKNNKEYIERASKEETNALFDDELINTHIPVFLYIHGISQSRAMPPRVELYQLLQELDVHVIAFDYRGFADSTPVLPTQGGLVEDTRVVYSWLRGLVGSERPVFVWGHSMGSAIALKCFSSLQTQDYGLDLPQPQGLVLESGFNNIYEVLDHFPLAKLLNWLPHYYTIMIDTIRNSPDIRVVPEESVKGLKTPVLMLHARDDDIIPYLLATKLYGHILNSRRDEDERPIFKLFPSGGHMLICRDKMLPAVVEDFITKYKKFGVLAS